jgi:hypothetical protein
MFPSGLLLLQFESGGEEQEERSGTLGCEFLGGPEPHYETASSRTVLEDFS